MKKNDAPLRTEDNTCLRNAYMRVGLRDQSYLPISNQAHTATSRETSLNIFRPEAETTRETQPGLKLLTRFWLENLPAKTGSRSGDGCSRMKSSRMDSVTRQTEPELHNVSSVTAVVGIKRQKR